MQPIKPAVRKRLLDDPLMSKCIICGSPKVEWDHVFTGLGWKQINEWWAIAPLCYEHHRGKLRTKQVQQCAQLWCLMRAGDEPAKQYPKTDWLQLKTYLTKICLKLL